MPIAHTCFVLDRVRMAGPSYAGLGSGSGLVGEGSSELGSELQNCWVAFEHAGDGGSDPKSHKSEGFPAAQIFKTHKCQNTYCRSAHFSKAVKFVGAQNRRGTT